MEDSIKELTNKIDLSSKLLIKDNNYLIDGFNVRLNTRLLTIFNKHNIPFNKLVLDSSMNDYLINPFISASTEMMNTYKNLLYKYFDIINEYYHTSNSSKDKIKKVTSIFIKKIFDEKNPILNEKISYNFISDLKPKILVYDNYNLNTELEKRIIEDTDEITKEIIRNINEYLVRSMKDILGYVII